MVWAWCSVRYRRIISILLATAFDVEGAEAPWFIFWPIFDLIAVGILAVRASAAHVQQVLYAHPCRRVCQPERRGSREATTPNPIAAPVDAYCKPWRLGRRAPPWRQLAMP